MYKMFPEEEKALIEIQIELNEVKTKEKGIDRSMVANTIES